METGRKQGGIMQENLVNLSLEIGEMLLQCGGKVSRVESTIQRILQAYGFVRVDVFTITSEIQVTAKAEDGKIYSQIRRIDQWGIDLAELEILDRFCRKICMERPDCAQISSGLMQLRKQKQERNQSVSAIALSYLGAILSASGFTVFFGGNLMDALAAVPLACLITMLIKHSRFESSNQLLIYFMFAFITGILGGITVKISAFFGMFLNLDKICIGCIMLTIPGIAITNSIRDMLLGEIITGLFRLIQSLLIAMSIAGGFVAAYSCLF